MRRFRNIRGRVNATVAPVILRIASSSYNPDHQQQQQKR